MPRRKVSADTKAIIGANIKAKREQLRWSQGDAARRADVAQEMLSRWEKGHRLADVSGLLRVCVACQCPIDDLLGGIDEAYDAIIERRIPPDVVTHYRAKIDAIKHLTREAIDLTATAVEKRAPTPVAITEGRKSTADKSSRAHARRKRTPPK